MKYDITVVTGKESGAGTNANVLLTLYGSVSDSGKRPLTQAFRDLFEKGQTDHFQLEAIDLGQSDVNFQRILSGLPSIRLNQYLPNI